MFTTRRSRGVCAVAALFVLAGVFFVAQPALSQGFLQVLTGAPSFEQLILNVIGVILQWLVYAVGSLLLVVVQLLINVAQYTGFGESSAVNLGWAVVRDITNMFFVLLMLVVAFGTILGIQEFSYRNMLPRLLIMAVVINFSKVIAGLFIDFSQVIMLTFVNGFAAVAGANIVNMLKINTYTSLRPDVASVAAQEINVTWDHVGGFFLALTMMGIALAVMVILMIILVFRIVMLWLLVILSPLAFMLSAFPRGRAAQAYGRWWEEFGNYLTIGPFMAFFLWLSFAVAGTKDIGTEFPQTTPAGEEGRRSQEFITVAGSQQNTISYVVGIALLMGGMMLSTQFSVLGGSMMGGAANWVKDKGAKAVKAPLKGLAKGGAWVAKDVDSRIAKATGVSLNVPAYFRGATAGLKARQDDRYKAGKEKIGRLAARGGALGRVAQLAGDPEKFMRAYGILEVAKLATGRVPRRGTEFYSQKAEEQKAAQKARQADIQSIQKERGDWVNKTYRTSIMQDYADLQAQAASAATDAERDRLTEDAKKLRGLLDSAEKKGITGDQLQEMAALSPKLKGSLEADRRWQAFDPREVDQEQAIAAARKQELSWAEKAARARPRGALPEEYGKHALEGDFLKAEADQAIAEGDKAGFMRVMRKMAADDPNGFAKAAGVEQSGAGLKKYLEDSAGKVKMDRQEMLALASEISSVSKTKSPNYTGMVKVATGGVLDWNDEIESLGAQASSKLAGDRGKAMREKQLIGHRDSEGNAQISDADIAALAYQLQSFTQALTDPRGINAKSAAILIEKQEEIVKRLKDTKLGIDPNALKDFEDAITGLKTSIGKLPEKMSDVVRLVKGRAT